jgi:hypothetical protein
MLDISKENEVNLQKPNSSHSSNENESESHGEQQKCPPPNAVAFDDSSFHCPYLLSMEYNSLGYFSFKFTVFSFFFNSDPSLALGFLLKNSEDYSDLVHRLRVIFISLPK